MLLSRFKASLKVGITRGGGCLFFFIYFLFSFSITMISFSAASTVGPLNLSLVRTEGHIFFGLFFS